MFVQRMVASLLTAFGALALLLATVGLYGVIATLSRRRACGATQSFVDLFYTLAS